MYIDLHARAKGAPTGPSASYFDNLHDARNALSGYASGMEGGKAYRDIDQGRSVADGWLGVGWPKEYGGKAA